MTRRFLFSVIIFSLIKWSEVLPINVPCENENQLKEIKVVRRECKDFKNFVGSNLFDGSRKVCFSPEDVNLLVVRREFEMMIPKELPEGLLNDTNISHILRYFYYGFWLLRRIDDCNSQRILEKAFYDTLGGFLRYYLVPVCKFSFYASKMELKTVRNVMMLYQKCRIFLNTNGNGWRPPMRNPLTEIRSVIIETIRTDDPGSFNEDKCCSDLDLTTASNGMEIVDDNMIVALPKIELEDGDGYLSNIWLPFSRKRTYNLRSCKSAFILFKFYRSVMHCYKVKSLPQKCFDQKFRQWIVENLKMHLGDEQFYPGLGGLLNIYETVRIGSKTADTSNSNKNEDEQNFIPQIEANLIDPGERTLDNGPKVYGDRNLDDWLKEYDGLYINANKHKRSYNSKHKRRIKMKKRKNKKRRKEVCATPIPVIPTKPCPIYETTRICTKSPSVTSTTNDKDSIPSPQTGEGHDLSPDKGSSTSTGTSPSSDENSTVLPGTGTDTNTNNHDSNTETYPSNSKGSTQDNKTSPNEDTTKASTSENIPSSSTDTSTQSTTSKTTDLTSDKNIVLDDGTTPSKTESSSIEKDTTSIMSASTQSSTSTSTSTVSTTSSLPVSSLPQTQSDNTNKFVINFILFIIMTLLFLLLLIVLLIFCRKLCNGSRIGRLKEYFEKLIEKSKRATSPKVDSTTTVTQSAKSPTKSETVGKGLSKDVERKGDKKGKQSKNEKKNENEDKKAEKGKKEDIKAVKDSKKADKSAGREDKNTDGKTDKKDTTTKETKKGDKKEKPKEKKVKKKAPKSTSSSTTEKVEDTPRRNHKKAVIMNPKGRTRQKRKGRVVRHRSRSQSPS